MALDLFECQTHKWYPDIGNNLEQPIEDRAYCTLTEFSAPESLALAELLSDIDKAKGVFNIVDEHLVDCVNFEWRGEKLTRDSFLGKVSAARLADIFAFLQEPVKKEDLENLGVPSSGI